MSIASDLYEKEIAEYINTFPNLTAVRSNRGIKYPDVLITHNGKEVWLEVKMNHTDNLANPRVSYNNGLWNTTYSTPAAAAAVKILNSDPNAAQFINKIAAYSEIPLENISVPTTKTGLKSPHAVPLAVMKNYFDQEAETRYISIIESVDLGAIVTEHYTNGKTQPAYYMQAGDDLYRISDKDPLNLGNNIPLLEGIGDFKIRVATRSQYYEIQAEIKINKMPESLYSIKPGSLKQNPFLFLS